MPLTAFTGILGQKRASHLLRRITFGATRAQIDAFAVLTPQQAIDNLFNNTLAAPLPPIDPKTNLTWVNVASTKANSNDSDLQEYFKHWWFGQMLAHEVQGVDQLAYMVREKIVYFLHTHFCAIQSVVASSRALYFQNVLFRQYALDENAPAEINFLELTKKISVENAMLILLDGRLNVKGDVNENYARELLELYSIGKGLAGHIPPGTAEGDYIYFTETDVRSAAKVLSGYDVDYTFTTIDQETLLPTGKIKLGSNATAFAHDNTTKKFSFRFGNAEIIPDPLLLVGNQPTAESMADELDQLIKLIYNQQETAKHICRKLYRFFVYHEIDTALDDTIITQMADTFTSSGFKLEPVIKDLLQSAHFYDTNDTSLLNDQFGAIIKSPLELVTNTLVFFEYQLPSYTNDTIKYHKKLDTLMSYLNDMGMNLMNPQDVAGYNAYHQFPLFNRSWISTNTLTQRYNFIDKVITIDAITKDESINIDVYSFIKSRFSDVASNPDELIKVLISYLFSVYNPNSEITIERLNYFKERFFSLGSVLPQGPLAFWQFSWANAEGIPNSKVDARGMLQDLINAICQSPENQLQ